MSYSSVSNPRWANPEHTKLDCFVIFDHLGSTPVPFTAVPSGDYDYTHKIFSECASGKYGTVSEYIPVSVD